MGTTRFDTASPRRLRADKDADVSRPPTSASPADAAVLAFGSTAHLIGRLRQLGYSVDLPDIADELFIQAGEHEWLIRAGVDYLRTRRARYRFGDTVLD